MSHTDFASRNSRLRRIDDSQNNSATIVDRNDEVYGTRDQIVENQGVRFN
jgi:hypothetical protein